MDLMTRIKERIRIEDYVTTCGYHLERHGATHLRIKEHSSFIIDPRTNRFYWNSRNAKGTVIDLVMLIEGVSQQEAIRRLAKQLGGAAVRPPKAPPPAAANTASKEQLLELPQESKKHWRRIYAYLLNTRQIERSVFDWLADGGYIYPDEHGNMIYLAKKGNTPIYAAAKGTVQSKRYMHVFPGSNYTARAAWNITANNTAWLVCEAAVDAWSLMSLFSLQGQSWQDFGFISLECCYPGPLRYYLSHFPAPKAIYLAQDADDAGETSRAAARRLLHELGYTGSVYDKRPPQGKDWNDYLKLKKGGAAHDR